MEQQRSATSLKLSLLFEFRENSCNKNLHSTLLETRRLREPVTAGLSNESPEGAMAPVIYFPGALIYSAGFNVNRNLKEKIFVNNSTFQFFS
jgi:hypothetical protein